MVGVEVGVDVDVDVGVDICVRVGVGFCTEKSENYGFFVNIPIYGKTTTTTTLSSDCTC